MSRAICTNDIIMHIARNPRQVRIARKVQKAHIPRNMYPNVQNAMLWRAALSLSLPPLFLSLCSRLCLSP